MIYEQFEIGKSNCVKRLTLPMKLYFCTKFDKCADVWKLCGWPVCDEFHIV